MLSSRQPSDRAFCQGPSPFKELLPRSQEIHKWGYPPRPRAEGFQAQSHTSPPPPPLWVRPVFGWDLKADGLPGPGAVGCGVGGGGRREGWGGAPPPTLESEQTASPPHLPWASRGGSRSVKIRGIPRWNPQIRESYFLCS